MLVKVPLFPDTVYANYYLGNVKLAAGTASTAPLTFTAGTLLTTASPGVMNYDGNVFYGTPSNTQRGIIPTEKYFVLDSALSWAQANTTQMNLMGVGVTVNSGIRYAFTVETAVQKSAGGGATVNFGLAGAATLSKVTYIYVSNSQGGMTTGNVTLTTGFATGTAVTSAGNNTAPFVIKINGYIDVAQGGGGTIIPQIGWSGNPTTVVVAPGTTMRVTPVGVIGANVSVGTWA